MRPSLIARQWAYHAGPSRFGTYPVLLSSSAMTSYPDPLPVPTHIPRPEYVPSNFFTAPWGEHEMPAMDQDQAAVGEKIEIGSKGEQAVRKVCKDAAEILKEVGKIVKPGVTTAQLNEAVHKMIIDRGAYPAPLGYSFFPRSCTTSVNNVIVHGIPDEYEPFDLLHGSPADLSRSRPLHPQDIVNLDLTLFKGGYYGDTSATFVLPDTDKPGRDLVAATEEALDIGIKLCKPGVRYNEIGKAIEDFAFRHGFSVNTQVSGHGIGKRFHQPPWIFHGRNTEPGKMEPGDCFTIEPCLVQGRDSKGDMWDDGWTLASNSGARTAQSEHQVLVTPDGFEILT